MSLGPKLDAVQYGVREVHAVRGMVEGEEYVGTGLNKTRFG